MDIKYMLLGLPVKSFRRILLKLVNITDTMLKVVS